MLFYTFASAEIINVPNDYDTIKNAIDSASNGDTLLVAQNTYYEEFSINKNIGEKDIRQEEIPTQRN